MVPVRPLLGDHASEVSSPVSGTIPAPAAWGVPHIIEALLLWSPWPLLCYRVLQRRLSPGTKTSLFRSCPGAERVGNWHYWAEAVVTELSSLLQQKSKPWLLTPLPWEPNITQPGTKSRIIGFTNFSPSVSPFVGWMQAYSQAWVGPRYPFCSLKCLWMWALWTISLVDFKDSTWVSMVILQSWHSICVC